MNRRDFLKSSAPAVAGVLAAPYMPLSYSSLGAPVLIKPMEHTVQYRPDWLANQHTWSKTWSSNGKTYNQIAQVSRLLGESATTPEVLERFEKEALEAINRTIKDTI